MKTEAYEAMNDHDDSHFWFVGRQKIIFSFIENFVFDKSITNILDYGCGSGYISEAVIKAYPQFRVTSADHDENALTASRARRLPRVVDMNTNKLEKSHYDLILCLDVMEHIEKDQEFVEYLKTLLAPNGKLILTVPAFESLWSGEDYVSNHVRRYRLKQLKNILIKAKFHIKKISYFNFFLFAPIVFTIFYNRLFHPKEMYQSNVKPLSLGLNNFLARVFGFESPFLRMVNFPFGFSLITVVENHENEIKS